MERFVIILNGWKPLTIITKRSILDVAASPDPPMIMKHPSIVAPNISILFENVRTPMVFAAFSGDILKENWHEIG